ncbi:MAG: hypothetical protein IKC64_03895, partial [Clostridia bacterium]|nr:hypothetical protein [Clostridia bacterium]
MVYLLALISLVFTHFYHYQAIKIYQLSYYRLNEFIHSLKSKKLAAVLYCVAPVIFLIFALIFPYISIYIALCQLLFSVLVYIYYRKRAKTQIKYTRRLTLFLVFSAIFLVPISIILALCNLSPILVLTYPFCGLISHFIVGRVYAIKNRNYIKKAQEKLKKINPIVIGVVGSYGKTTTKFALTTILRQKYAVKCTRENFNTPLGIARTIDENLDENTQVFVMEMGARYKGDIAEICSNFTPDYAVITAVGNQHLDTFKSLETVYQTKGEILDFITDGTVFINGYDDGAKRLCGRAKSKVLVSGSENTASYSNCVT